MSLTYATGVVKKEPVEVLTCDWDKLEGDRMARLGGLVYFMAERMHEQRRTESYVYVTNFRGAKSDEEVVDALIKGYEFFERVQRWQQKKS